MARPQSMSKMGFYPTPPHLIPSIAEYMEVKEPDKTLILDPCAGAGEALSLLGNALGVEKLFANELDESRADQCRAAGHIVACGDGVSELMASLGHFSLVYLNPPYDFEGEGGGRTEFKFLRTLRFLRRDGILVYVVPLAVLRRREFLEKLPLRVKDIAVRRFPDADYEPFRQAVLFARKKEGRIEAEFANFRRQVADPPILGDGQLPPLGRYIVPPAEKGRTYFYSKNLDTHTRVGLCKTPVAQKILSQGLSHAIIKDDEPLTELRQAHKAMMLASGRLNGFYRQPDGSLVALAGLTVKTETEIVETNDDHTTTRTRTMPTAKVLGLSLEESMNANELVIFEYM